MSGESARGDQGQDFKFPTKEKTPMTAGEAEEQAEQAASDVVGKKVESDEVRAQREAKKINDIRRNIMHGGMGNLGVGGFTRGAEASVTERPKDDVSGVPADVLEAWDSFSNSDVRFDALKMLGVPDKENMNINSAKDLVAWSKKKRGFFGSIKSAFSTSNSPAETLNLFASQNLSKENKGEDFLGVDALKVVKNAASQKKVEASSDRSGQGGLTR